MGTTFVLPERCEVRIIDEQVVIGAPTITEPAKVRPIETASVQLARENKLLRFHLERQYQKARRFGDREGCTDRDAHLYVETLLLDLQSQVLAQQAQERAKGQFGMMPNGT